jgi:hypothetical protein
METVNRSRYSTLPTEVRGCIDALLVALEEVGRAREVASAEHSTTFQGVIAEMEGLLRTLGDLVEHSLAEVGRIAETNDALRRLIEQARARRHDIQQELERTWTTPAGDWQARVAALEAVRSQLDKLVQVVVQELIMRSKPPEP